MSVADRSSLLVFFRIVKYQKPRPLIINPATPPITEPMITLLFGPLDIGADVCKGVTTGPEVVLPTTLGADTGVEREVAVVSMTVPVEPGGRDERADDFTLPLTTNSPSLARQQESLTSFRMSP